MGQGSSKRRFSIKNKNGEAGSQEGANGRREGGQDASSISPASPTPSSPSNISGKKEKRKKFSLGLSLRRSPSGRWSRKKRSSALNGARPVSCPDPNDGSLTEPAGRPQSLFLDPVEIQEDQTNEIDTVDLSDTEDQKSTPKSPEKNKLKKDFNKKSPSKKRNGKLSPKKEKQSPKKDKLSPKRDKQSSKRDKSQKQKAEDTLEVRTDQTESSQVDRTNTGDSPGPGAQSPSVGQQEADPLEIIAASIVAETVKNAQERLRLDAQKDLTNEPLEETTYESIDIQNNEKVSPNRVLELPDSQKSHLPHSVSEVKNTDEEPASKMAEEIMYEVMNKPEASSPELITKTSIDTKGRELVESSAESCEGLPLEEVRDIAMISKDLKVGSDKTSEPTCHKEGLSESDQSKLMEMNPLSGDEPLCLDTTDSSDTIEEIVAKQIVQTVLAAALDVVGRNSNSQDTVHKHSENSGQDTGGLEQESKHGDELEKNETVTETTANDSFCEMNEKKVEKDEALPPEKEKSKNKVSKKFNQWFHKKEKQPKISNEKVTKSIELPQSKSGETSEESSQTTEARAGSLTADTAVSLDCSPTPPESFGAITNVDVNESSISQHIQTTQSQIPVESTKLSSSTSHKSSTSETDETAPVPPVRKSEGGFLKKISLGPRLKTAVLRKKSSSAADKKEKHSVAAAASSQGDDVLTAPPRKSRHRKKEDTAQKSKKEDANLSLTLTEEDTSFSAGQTRETQDFSKTPDNSNPQMSESNESKLALTLKSESSETNLTVSDSGVADLTSPELADLSSPEVDNTLINKVVKTPTSVVDASPAQTEDQQSSSLGKQNVIRTFVDNRDSLPTSTTGVNIAAIHQSVKAAGVTQSIDKEAITQSFEAEAINKSADDAVLTQSCSSHPTVDEGVDGGVLSDLGNVEHSVDKTPVTGGAVEARVECQDWIHSSPLSSPTLISTASITLRSTSFDGSPACSVPTSSAENSTDAKMAPSFQDSNTRTDNVLGSPFDRQSIQEPTVAACDAVLALEGLPVTSKSSSLSLREVILEANVSASSEYCLVPAPSTEGSLVSETRIPGESLPQDKPENLSGSTTHIFSEHQKTEQSLPEATKRGRTIAEYAIGISAIELVDGRESNGETSLDE